MSESPCETGAACWPEPGAGPGTDARPADVVGCARDAAARAMRSDPNRCETQHVLGQVSWQLEWNWPHAEAAFRRAMTLDASSGWPQSMLGHLLSQTGRQAEALPLMRRARELDPYSAAHHAMSSQVAFQARDYGAASEHARQAIVVDPDFWVGYMMRGQAGMPQARLVGMLMLLAGPLLLMTLISVFLSLLGRKD